MNDSKHVDQMTEQIRLSYAHLIKNYMQLCNKYKQFKNKVSVNGEEIKTIISFIDLYLYDEIGKINWNNLFPLMPLNIEQNIKQEYGILSENEVKLCCLLLFNVSCNDITNILPYTQNSVHSITHKIKQKTEMKDIIESLKKLLLLE